MFRNTVIALLVLLAPVSYAALNNKQISSKDKDIKIFQTNKNGIPTVVAGNLQDKVAKGAELATVHEYFERNKKIYKIESPTTELKLTKIETDNLGMIHLRLKQQYKGLDVIGSNLTAHFRNDGMFTSVNGSYKPIKELSTIVQFLSTDALTRAKDDLRIDFGEGVPSAPELVIFPWQKETYLCWRFFLVSDSPMGRWEYFINAQNGDIVFKANRIMNIEAIGTGTGVLGNVYTHLDTWDNGSIFEMIDYTRRSNNNIHGHNGQMVSNAFIRTYLATSSLPGSVATDADNVWSGTSYAPAVDAHVYSSLFYDWTLKEFGRNSYDNNGSAMNISVNYSAEGDNNAYWNGSQIVIWSWSSGWRSLATCPDVIAHEWGHAITGSTSGLIYQLESGALNESFSDMIGAAFEFAHDTLDSPDWFMGENGIIGGTGFRDMLDPHSKGDPDFYGTSDPFWVDVVGCTPTNTNDWCGVHTNSGVANKWFSLLSDGGVHTGVTVNGLSVDTAILIAVRANTIYWNASTNYAEAAAGTVLAAQDLDPSGNWEAEVIKAWTAVGVSLPVPTIIFSYPNGTPTTLTPNVAEIFDVTVAGIFGGSVVPNSGQIYVSINGGIYQSSPMTEISSNNYQATLPGVPCGDKITYYFSADLVSPASTIFDGSALVPYTSVPATGTLTVFQDDFESNLGWTISGGNWARGVPTGGGGEYGGVDPTNGSVGPNVMGYNLNGDYANNIPEYHVTSPAIDCSTIETVRIQFDRWLGVEQPAYDHAYIRVSTDNSNWTTVWENSVEIADGSWNAIDFDISSLAALQSMVYVRFTMGTSDGGWRFCGWNIDNFRVTGTECIASSNIAITTMSLPNWTANFTYSQQLTATGEIGTLNWTDKNNNLTATGLTLSSTGILSGTATTGQVVSFTAMVTDDLGSDEQLLTFTFNSDISASSTTLDNWTDSYNFSHQFSATGGTGQLIFTDKNNDLNSSGLTLSSAGLLSGLPIAGSYNFVLVVADSIGATSETAISIQINSAVQITPISFPDWTAGIVFSEQIVATGGTGSLIFSDKNDDLSLSGLSLSTTGQLSGQPISGTYNFVCLVTDSIGASSEEAMSLLINDSLLVLTTSLTDWTEGFVYSQQMLRSGGTGFVTFVDKNNDLSGSGLSVTTTGLLSGIVTTAGLYSFTLQITDAIGATSEQLLSLNINDAVIIITTSLPDGNSDTTYTQQLLATGGTGLTTWLDKNNDLGPYSLILQSDGLLTGFPVIIDSISFTAVVTDEVGASVEQIFAFEITMGYVCGDFDNSGVIDISDLVGIVAFMFSGGPPPNILATADIDGSGIIDISDLVILVDFMFGGSGGGLVCGAVVN